MARGFNTTYGSGTTDKITSAVSANETAWSISWWMYVTTFSPATGGRVMEGNTGSIQIVVASGVLGYLNFTDWSSGSLNVDWLPPSTSVWHQYVLTHDRSSASNLPVLYIDGVAQTINTNSSTHTGSYTPPGVAYLIGNRAASNRALNGILAEVAMWSVALDAAEANALGKGFSPSRVRPDSIIEYFPFIRGTLSQVAGAPTVVGTAVQNHPRVIHTGAQSWQLAQPAETPSALIIKRLRGTPEAWPTQEDVYLSRVHSLDATALPSQPRLPYPQRLYAPPQQTALLDPRGSVWSSAALFQRDTPPAERVQTLPQHDPIEGRSTVFQQAPALFVQPTTPPPQRVSSLQRQLDPYDEHRSFIFQANRSLLVSQPAFPLSKRIQAFQHHADLTVERSSIEPASPGIIAPRPPFRPTIRLQPQDNIFDLHSSINPAPPNLLAGQHALLARRVQSFPQFDPRPHQADVAFYLRKPPSIDNLAELTVQRLFAREQFDPRGTFPDSIIKGRDLAALLFLYVPPPDNMLVQHFMTTPQFVERFDSSVTMPFKGFLGEPAKIEELKGGAWAPEWWFRYYRQLIDEIIRVDQAGL